MTAILPRGKGKRRCSYRCSCGVVGLALVSSLLSGNTKSCGHRKSRYHTSSPSGKEEIVARSVWARCQRTAREKGLCFDLSVADVQSVIFSDCTYCGAKPGNFFRHVRNSDEDVTLYTGIDRIDSSSGYLAENVISCCWTCNRHKSARTAVDFLNWCATVAGRRRLIEGQILWRKNLASKSA